jgi:hypothetical protein
MNFEPVALPAAGTCHMIGQSAAGGRQVTMAEVVEALCAGTLIVHLDESAWCSEPGCAARTTGDATAAAKHHPAVVTCSSYFAEGCPACKDIRVWTR